ncbi:hypothetical protein GCM10010912_34990 [Paenibacillus albidus]|uniref:Uncharacterized protein n=1 Tax=Paenibacillus albidus TaxID=2041023 RepID=A0A917CEY4_9BACL|nr:hypothetical protein [Paenibacillus albidus]GGF86718.1 hypothetical protein GCM10010912_34990 [Paenibacillus albidus]
MNNKTTNEEITNEEVTNEEVTNEEPMSEENMAELLNAVHHNGLVALRMHFKAVEGQIVKLEAYGPVFVYHVQDEAEHVYSCGFFLRELIARFQSGNEPAVWMASFFIDLMKNKGGKALPQPATSEDEAKAIIDQVLVPKLIEEVHEEFAPEQVHAGLVWNEEYGPVFESGFPAITEGNNVCAIPLHLLYTHLQLNRDPGEIVLQGLYNIRKEHGLD